jgi:hypothetical protein
MLKNLPSTTWISHYKLNPIPGYRNTKNLNYYLVVTEVNEVKANYLGGERTVVCERVLTMNCLLEPEVRNLVKLPL